MTRSSSIFSYLVLVFAFGAPTVFAHQPFESTAVARLQHHRLEVKLTMAAQMALQLAITPGFDDTNSASIESQLPRLREQATAFYTVTSGPAALAPIFTDVQLDKLGEVQAVLIFPEPPAGHVTISAAYLEKLPLGFTATLDVYDENETLLASTPKLARGQIGLAWPWSPISLASSTTAPALTRSPAQPEIPLETTSGSHALLWRYGIIFGLGALLLPALLWVRHRQLLVAPRHLTGGNTP